MEIRIDTTKDSKEDIRRAVKFLQEIIEGGSREELPTGENVMGSMFDMPLAQTMPEETPAVQEKPAQKEKEKQKVDGLELY
jgi:hypothetical protein